MEIASIKYFITKRYMLIILTKVLLLYTLSILLYSCSASDPYPDEWGYVMDVKKYSDTVISGNYNIIGSCTKIKTREHSITSIIELPGFYKADSAINNIIIKLYNEDSLLIFLRAGSDTIYKTVFPENGVEFSLTDDGLEMEPQKSKGGGDLGLILPLFSSSKVILMKGEDSSLIAKYHGWGVGLLMLLPVYASGTTWYKFPGYNNN